MIRSLGWVLLVLAVLAGRVSSASAQATPAPAPSPWYLEGSVGGIWPADRSFSTSFFNAAGLSGPGTNTQIFDPGPVVTAGIGYKLAYGFRVELEAGYAHYLLAKVRPVSTNGVFPTLNGSTFNVASGGTRDVYFDTLNLFYDLPSFGNMTPYIGGGGGTEYYTSATGHFTDAAGNGFFSLGGHATYLLAMAEVGFEYKVTPNWSVVPSYRYQWAFPQSGSPLGAQLFKLGVRYSPW